MGDDWAAEVTKAVEQYVNDNMPEGVSVPTGVSEDEAARAVQERFTKAGFGCPDELARDIVRRARESAR
jgi:hypothetical protein